MNERIEEVIKLAKLYEVDSVNIKSSDVTNTLKFDYHLEIGKLYNNIHEKSLKEDIRYLLDLIDRIERSNGKKYKKNLLDTVMYLENIL